MRIRLHLERVVLHGVSALDAPRFQSAFQDELAHLIATRGVPARVEASWRADALAPIPETLPQRPEEIGRWVAQRLYGALA